MTVLSFDLNAGRVRAVSGPSGEFAFMLPLQPPREELPLIVNLEGKVPTVGFSALQICREKPHAVYRDFFHHLGEVLETPHSRPFRQQNLDSEKALSLVFDSLRPIISRHEGLILSLPPYLGSHQVFLVKQIAKAYQVPVLGSIANPLAIALTSFAEHNWKRHAIVVDVDEHALWLSWLREEEGQVRVADEVVYPHLGLAQWKKRLFNTLADLCIKESRKDPRHCPEVEQSLYSQLDSVMEECAANRMANVAFQKKNWYQHLALEPEKIATYFSAFVRTVVTNITAVLERHIPPDTPKSILVSAQASVLPGLVGALEEYLEFIHYRNKSSQKAPSLLDEEDFGENLLDEQEYDDSPKLILLSPDASARGAHLLSEFCYRGEFPSDHFLIAAPLPALQGVDAGPARLRFQGRDVLLNDRPFTIGRRHDCHLILEKTRFPHVSPWHCEIIYDPRRYLLRDYSREGTWINDRPVTQITMLSPGDCIRLGPKGPVLRYLGQPESRAWTTTA